MNPEPQTPASHSAAVTSSFAKATEDKGDISNAEKLKARLDYLEDWYFRPQSYETKISQWEVKELKQHRPWLWKEAEEEVESGELSVESGNIEGRRSATVPTAMVPKYFSKQSDLAQWLHDHFKARISISIDSTRIGQWRRGSQLGQVFVNGAMVKPPPFPNKGKSGVRWVTQECIDWVEKWIVPQWKVEGGALRVEGPGAAVDFDNYKKEHEMFLMKRERDIADGKFKSVEIFNQHLTAFGLAVNRALNEGEKTLKKRILEEIEKAKSGKAELLAEGNQPSTINHQLISDAIDRGVRAAVDLLRAGVAKAILDAEETTVLHELH